MQTPTACASEGPRTMQSYSPEPLTAAASSYRAPKAFGRRVDRRRVSVLVGSHLPPNSPLQLTHESDTFFAKRKKFAPFVCS
jgi:hypothetical protein